MVVGEVAWVEAELLQLAAGTGPKDLAAVERWRRLVARALARTGARAADVEDVASGVVKRLYLSARASALVADRSNSIYVSSASAWEISTKHRIGRLPEASVLVQDMAGWFERAGLTELPITVAHAQRAGTLTQPHRDPFDRMLAAQALIEELPIIGRDEVLRDFGVALVW